MDFSESLKRIYRCLGSLERLAEQGQPDPQEVKRIAQGIRVYTDAIAEEVDYEAEEDEEDEEEEEEDEEDEEDEGDPDTVELGNGGAMEWESDGTIRYIDMHGNSEDHWSPGDPDYDTYKKDYFPNHVAETDDEDDEDEDE